MASHDRPIKRAAGELVSLKRVIGALKESLKPYPEESLNSFSILVLLNVLSTRMLTITWA